MKYVLVTTEYRGVFAGELVHYALDERRITLANARCAIKWGTENGFLELAEVGPNYESIIGGTAPEIVLHGVTSVAHCTDKAAEAWKNA